jgi:tetratricopeptide (TPR) repeat protein
LTGNVIVADGRQLTEPAYVERVCGGRVFRDGRTDFKGFFTITIGPYAPRLSAEGSAETSGMGNSPFGSRSQDNVFSVQNTLISCELRASLAGFRSSSIRMPTEALGNQVGPVNVGTIVLEKMGESQGTTVSATSLKASKDAKKAYDKGHQAIERKKLPEAQQDLEKAVQLYPQYAAAWLDLGWLYGQQQQLDKARNAFTQAETADERFVAAYVGLASVALRESKWQEAATWSSRATEMDGVDFPAAFYYNALANYRLGNMDQAEKSARKAEALGAQNSFPQVSLLLGMVLANRGDYAAAADQLRLYLKAAPTAPNADAVRQQLANVESTGAAESKAQAAPTDK